MRNLFKRHALLFSVVGLMFLLNLALNGSWEIFGCTVIVALIVRFILWDDGIHFIAAITICILCYFCVHLAYVLQGDQFRSGHLYLWLSLLASYKIMTLSNESLGLDKVSYRNEVNQAPDIFLDDEVNEAAEIVIDSEVKPKNFTMYLDDESQTTLKLSIDPIDYSEKENQGAKTNRVKVVREKLVFTAMKRVKRIQFEIEDQGAFYNPIKGLAELQAVISVLPISMSKNLDFVFEPKKIKSNDERTQFLYKHLLQIESFLDDLDAV